MVKWIEVIKLRSAGNRERLLEVLRPMTKSARNGGLVEMKIYRHAALETDLSVHLYWESERPDENGSNLGLRIAQALKDFGLIDHSVWIEGKNEFALYRKSILVSSHSNINSERRDKK
jgi:hypothetical protein